MKHLLILTALLIATVSLAHDHPPHNLILMGEQEIFGTHMVYKTPHNYQVNLSLAFNDSDRAAYVVAHQQYPNDTFLFRLDPMDISQIQAATSLSGPILREAADGTRYEVVHHAELSAKQFKVLYFDELPLSLQ